MRSQRLLRIGRSADRALLLAVLLLATLPRAALAADALMPPVDSDGLEPIVRQVVPTAPGPASTELVSTPQFVEDPTRQAGGEDDARRAYERQQERQNAQNDDDGNHRRK